MASFNGNGSLTVAQVKKIVASEIEEYDFNFDLSDEEVNRITDHVKKNASVTLDNLSPEQIATLVEQVSAKVTPPPARIELVKRDGKVKKITGTHHAALADVLLLAKHRKNVLMIGPSGCGKTHLGDDVAKLCEEKKLEFAFISCSAGMSEGQLLGRLLPVGRGGKFQYVISDFVRLFENGGVFLFDEIDAADSNTLLIINAALANGKMAVPNRPEKPYAERHPDFICLAAANTYGTGADRQYVGRNQLDEATLDRFRIGQIEMDYDPQVEEMLCPDKALRERLQGYRANIRKCNGIRRIVSTRFLKDAYEMKEAGWTDERIDKALFAGWSKDEVAKAKGTF